MSKNSKQILEKYNRAAGKPSQPLSMLEQTTLVEAFDTAVGDGTQTQAPPSTTTTTTSQFVFQLQKKDPLALKKPVNTALQQQVKIEEDEINTGKTSQKKFEAEQQAKQNTSSQNLFMPAATVTNSISLSAAAPPLPPKNKSILDKMKIKPEDSLQNITLPEPTTKKLKTVNSPFLFTQNSTQQSENLATNQAPSTTNGSQSQQVSQLHKTVVDIPSSSMQTDNIITPIKRPSPNPEEQSEERANASFQTDTGRFLIANNKQSFLPLAPQRVYEEAVEEDEDLDQIVHLISQQTQQNEEEKRNSMEIEGEGLKNSVQNHPPPPKDPYADWRTIKFNYDNNVQKPPPVYSHTENDACAAGGSQQEYNMGSQNFLQQQDEPEVILERKQTVFENREQISKYIEQKKFKNIMTPIKFSKKYMNRKNAVKSVQESAPWKKVLQEMQIDQNEFFSVCDNAAAAPELLPQPFQQYNIARILEGTFNNKKLPLLHAILIDYDMVGSLLSVKFKDFSGDIVGSFAKSIFREEEQEILKKEDVSEVGVSGTQAMLDTEQLNLLAYREGMGLQLRLNTLFIFQNRVFIIKQLHKEQGWPQMDDQMQRYTNEGNNNMSQIQSYLNNQHDFHHMNAQAQAPLGQVIGNSLLMGQSSSKSVWAGGHTNTAYDDPIAYYQQEACRLYIANVVLTNQVKELLNEKNELMNKIAKLERQQDNYVQLAEDKKKRHRRAAHEIERHYRCPVDPCQKQYGSEGSLAQHIKLKHPDFYNTISNNISQTLSKLRQDGNGSFSHPNPYSTSDQKRAAEQFSNSEILENAQQKMKRAAASSGRNNDGEGDNDDDDVDDDDDDNTSSVQDKDRNSQHNNAKKAQHKQNNGEQAEKNVNGDSQGNDERRGEEAIQQQQSRTENGEKIKREHFDSYNNGEQIEPLNSTNKNHDTDQQQQVSDNI